MIEEGIQAYGREKGFHQQTVDRWLRLAEPDREALLDLARELRIGENHLRDFLDWIEEIALRDGVTFYNVLKGESVLRISSDPRWSRNDKLKQIKEEVRRLRFPRLARVEEEIQKRIRALKLKPQIQITVPPGLEGGAVTVQLKATGHQELKELVSEVAQAVEGKAVEEIFALVGGESTLPSSLPFPRRGEGEVEGSK